MGNHYHLLIETPEGNLSKGMRQLNGIYTQQFNRRHKRVGHIFQGRYEAILVDKDSYIKELCRYIVLNPVRAGIVQKAREYKWSSYASTAGYTKGISCLTTDWILLQFGRDRTKAEKLYREFVREGYPLKGQQYLGDETFLDKIKELIKDKKALKEIPRAQQYVTRPSLDSIITKGKDKESRDKSIFEANVKYGYSLKEIGEYIGVHYSTISRAVKRIEKE